MNPLVSIIIPCFNYEEFICECIQSCLDQTYENIEVIVVDDNSTDNSKVFIANMASTNKKMKVYHNRENKGYSYCKNLGIKEAKGEYIAHLDADDLLTPNSIKIRLQHFLDNPKLDMVHGLAWKWRWSEEDGEWQIDGYNENSKIHAQGILIKRSVYERFGLYYEQLRSRSDKEMVFRLGIHPKSPLPTLIKAKKIKNFIAFYRKHEKQMHKQRRLNKDIGRPINKIFKQRIKDLAKEGVTKENTKWL